MLAQIMFGPLICISVFTDAELWQTHDLALFIFVREVYKQSV